MHIALILTALLLGAPAHLSPGALPPDSTGDRARRQASPRLQHALYFGLRYQPGPGLRLTGTYEYAGLPAGVLSFTGGWSGDALGSVGYRFSRRGRTWPPRQFQVAPEVFSDFTPNRLLDDAAADERRTGGRLTLALQGRTLTAPYRLYAEGQHVHVALAPHDAASISRRWLTTVDVGGTYTLARRPLLPDALAQTRLRVGWPHPQTAFVTLRAAGRWLRPIGAGFDAVFDGQVQWDSPNTPAYEQASFGGMTSVRGYRADAALGRRLWTLQSELWIPLPGMSPTHAGLAGILGRYVRLAAFFDVGGVSRTTGGLSANVRSGLGLGLRLLIGPVTLRIDWGHRLTGLRANHFRGDIYVSAQSNVASLLAR